MNLYSLIKHSLWHYRRTSLGVLVGTAVGTAVLTGALMVGDAVQGSLETRVDERLGKTTFAIASGDTFTTASLSERLVGHLGTHAAAVITLRGSMNLPGGSARANHITVHGVDRAFFALSLNGTEPQPPLSDGVALNPRLAKHLGVSLGDTVVIRVDTPGAINRDLPVGAPNATAAALRLHVSHILQPRDLGRFSLRAEQTLPMNAFVARDLLADKLDLAGQANLILLASDALPSTSSASRSRATRGTFASSAAATPSPRLETSSIQRAIQAVWTPEDAGLSLRTLPSGIRELQSRRVFIEDRIVQAAHRASTTASTVLTYFVNTIATGSGSTPYSFIAGLEHSPLTKGMPDEGIVVNRWLAEDLSLSTNDAIELSYYVVDQQNRLTETSRTYRVHRIVEQEKDANDPTLMPDFPGLSDVDNCRDWDPGMPIDVTRVREKDEAYWDSFRGTPKAFVTLSAAQSMWSNRHGLATAVRFPPQQGDRDALLGGVLSQLHPGDAGMRILPIREIGLRASREGVSFGQLFLGLSFFLIVAALLLTGLLFAFSIEQRAEETGLLLAVGLPLRTIRRFRLIEGACIALPGAALGVTLGVLCDALILRLLSGAWQTIVGTVSLPLRVLPATCLIGFVSGALTAWISMWLSARRQLIRQPSELQRARTGSSRQMRISALLPLGAGALCCSISAAIVLVTGSHGGSNVAGIFFGAGALALIGCLFITYGGLSWLSRQRSSRTAGLTETALRACARRPRHSLAIVALLAAGAFIVIATGANRPGAPQEVNTPTSGTGGFELFAESALPIFEDLQTEAGRRKLGIDSDLDVRIVPMRVFEGDDASCLNLNRVTHPTLLGVAAENLEGRFSFAGCSAEVDTAHPWAALDTEQSASGIPAIADQSTILWGLGKSIGDTLPALDGQGMAQTLRFAAGTANSILQGSVLISEANFVAYYPNSAGYRVFLIDVDSGDPLVVGQQLSLALSDYGFEVTPTPARLASFASIQDTYLSIFMVLGALALLLGSVGMGVVVARNVMERRGELAMLSALGFKRRTLHRLLLVEHTALFSVGLFSGAASGLVAVLPALRTQGTPVSPHALGLLLTALLINGLFWITAAVAFATRGPLLPALREE